MPTEFQRWLNPRSVGGQYALATVILTIFAGASGLARANLVLEGDAVLHQLKLWTVVTNVFLVVPDPFSIIFSILVFIWTGEFLQSHWGRRRLWAFILGIGGGASLVMVGLAALFPSLGLVPYFGGGAIFSAMWVAQGLLIASRQVSFFGIPLTGYALAAVGAAFPVLNGLFRSPLIELQTYVALLLTAAWVRGWGPMVLVNQFRAWRLAKSLKRRSGHLTVLSGDEKNPPRGSDRYLH